MASGLSPSSIAWFYINGQLQTYTSDYSIASTTLTIVSGRPAPTASDVLKLYGSVGYVAVSGGSSGTSGTSGIDGFSGTTYADFYYSGNTLFAPNLNVSTLITYQGSPLGTSGGSGSSGTSGTSGSYYRQISLVANLANAGDTGTINQTLLGIGYSGTIIGWYMSCYPSSNVTVDIWKASGGVPTIANTITASAKPNITGAQINNSSSLSGWTTSISPGDYFLMNIDSNSAATYINLQLIIGI
jgi:hypothetical protein